MRLKILLILALLAGSAQPALACKCAQDPNAPPEGSEEAVKAALESVDAVFVGRVTGMQSRIRFFFRMQRYRWLTRDDREISDEEEDRIFRRRVTLSVEEPFKGAGSDRITLYTGWGGGDCGYEFRRGSRYLVYASGRPGDLWTGICHATKRAEKAASEIAMLRRIAVP